MRSRAVACSNPSSTEAGFATPAAVIVSLALAMIAIAITTASVRALRHARADLARAQAEFALEGGQERAALAALSFQGEQRFSWNLSTDAGAMSVLAEPEASKLSLTRAAELSATSLQELGASDPRAVKAGLAKWANDGLQAHAIAALDPGPRWRACAQSAISPFGAAGRLQLARPVAPTIGPQPRRAGEVWRIRVAAQGGWTDDRLVRFTGNESRPVEVIDRRFWRTSDRGDGCDVVIGAS